MVYDKKRINKIIEYKDNIMDPEVKENIEWLICCYNTYYADSKEYERKHKNYNKILNQYYNLEEEKTALRRTIFKLQRKNQNLKRILKSITNKEPFE